MSFNIWFNTDTPGKGLALKSVKKRLQQPTFIFELKVSILMPIFREQRSISHKVHTKSISIRTYVCKVVQQLFIEQLSKK